MVDFERGARTPYRNNLAAIQRALEAAGVEFLPDNGVRLKGAQAAPKPERGSASEPGGDQAPEPVASKSSAPRKAAPRAKAAAMSKEAQLRALRERDTQ